MLVIVAKLLMLKATESEAVQMATLVSPGLQVPAR